MNRAGNFLGGILLGGIVGSVVALLLAPDTGANFRAQIREYVDSVDQRVNQASDTRLRELEE
jgi:gas vesicle protein